MPGERQTPAVRLRRLAAELRFLRTSSGFTRDEIVERTGINVATLYRIEHARARPQTRTLRTLLDLYRVEGAHQDELTALLRDAGQRGWRHAYQSVLTERRPFRMWSISAAWRAGFSGKKKPMSAGLSLCFSISAQERIAPAFRDRA
jgi:transcriptional regulator with XRE-family HTH domain